MNKELIQDISNIIKSDGDSLNEFYNELRGCMESKDDVKIFDEYFINMMLRRDEKIDHIKKNLIQVLYNR
jgi:hypothetical protein